MRSRAVATGAKALAIFAIALTIASCSRHPCPYGTKLMGQPPPDGQELWCEKIVDGKPVKEGLFTLYFPNGLKMIEGNYHDGKQAGEWRTWYQNGRLSAIDRFREGVQDGLHVSWYEDGTRAVQGEYRNGKREGRWHFWAPDGIKNWDEHYKDDKRVS